MHTIEIIGYTRANFDKQSTKKLRSEANVLGVLYGGKEQIHFYAPMSLFRELVYTPKAHFVHLNIEGTLYKCILQDIQFHPVSEMIMHVDFLEIFENKKIKMAIPTTFTGKAIGVGKGGVLSKKQRKLPVCAYPKDMPATINIDISSLDLGQIARAKDIQTKNYTILTLPTTPIASIAIPRSLRSAASKEETKGEK